MFQMPVYKLYLEGLLALQAREVRSLLADPSKAVEVKGSLKILESLGHWPEEVKQQIEQIEKEKNNATSRRK
jgi:hypothetical protein